MLRIYFYIYQGLKHKPLAVKNTRETKTAGNMIWVIANHGSNDDRK